MGAKRLLLLTDVPGVLDKDKKLIPELTVERLPPPHRRRHHHRRHDPEDRDLHLRASSAGVEAVVILDGKVPPRGAARAVHRLRRRHADPRLTAGPSLAAPRSYLAVIGAAGPLSVSRDERCLRRPHLSAADARGFGHVETWIFDLDNTLYPHEARVWPQVDERITLYIMQPVRARRAVGPRAAEVLLPPLRHDAAGADGGVRHRPGRLPRFRARHRPLGDRAEPGARRRHRAPARPQADPDQRLAQARRERRHASSASSTISRTCSTSPPPTSCPKPDRRAYERFLDSATRVEPRRAAMFEDIAKNLVVPHELGMTTCSSCRRPSTRSARPSSRRRCATPHIDHVTSDLAGFLASACCRMPHEPGDAQALVRRRRRASPRSRIWRTSPSRRCRPRSGAGARRPHRRRRLSRRRDAGRDAVRIGVRPARPVPRDRVGPGRRDRDRARCRTRSGSTAGRCSTTGPSTTRPSATSSPTC